jgi:alkanesulfonate monooxygenase SsuD/methylene tetrahydromethanopterin reductase-like flavin-dependent oxidoreductase (luciferase family)
LLVTAIAGSLTTRIRVGTAGVRLRYYNPLKLAEDASLLESLFPNRFDLGLIGGRDSRPEVDQALALPGSDDIEAKTAELLAYFDGTAQNGARVKSVRAPAPPPVWICSLDRTSARNAGCRGLKFAYSVYLPQLKGQTASTSILSAYRDSFSGKGDPEAVITCIGACAGTATAAQTEWARMTKADSRIFKPNSGRDSGGFPSPNFVGTASECREQLEELAHQFGVSELVVQCVSGHLAAKIAAYEMLANAS